MRSRSNKHSRPSADFVLGQLIIEDVVRSAFDPLHVTIAKKDIAPGSAMIIIPIRVIVDRPGALPIAIHDQKNLRGTNRPASQSENRILMDVAVNVLI